MPQELLQLRKQGLYCPAGDFFIDPWLPVKKAVITHSHGDHAHSGHSEYLTALENEKLLKCRIPDAKVKSLPYGKQIQIGKAKVSFHPAGHILGSSQIRAEVNGEVWVFTGDYKRDFDPTCSSFSPQICDVLISEATFALPIYRWNPTSEVAEDILDWWKTNASENRASVLFCYALGKAQRILAELIKLTKREVYIHGSLQRITQIYRDAGVKMAPTILVSAADKKDFSGDLIMAPPSAFGSQWMRRFGSDASTAFASGWMRVRGGRRRRGYDKGFVISDHADWPSLLKTIEESKAKKVYLTHGSSDVLVRYLKESGIEAESLRTQFDSEEEGAGKALENGDDG